MLCCNADDCVVMLIILLVRLKLYVCNFVCIVFVILCYCVCNFCVMYCFKRVCVILCFFV